MAGGTRVMASSVSRTVLAIGVPVLLLIPAAASTQPAVSAPPAVTPPALTPEQQEAFLLTAKVVRTRDAGKGVTGTMRATLTDGVITHDASIQTVDISMREFKSTRGVEFNFTDSWRYNVAAYRLNKLLKIGNVPVSVERLYRGERGAFTWWVDDVLMDEGERLKRKAEAPDSGEWSRQIWGVRLFDQLIYNVDRNMGNMLIDRQWVVWMIDHSRAFRLASDLKSPKQLRRIERGALERLKALDLPALDDAIGEYLTPFEKRALLKRRDAIVAWFEELGPSAIVDLQPRQ